jgi:hypothetical protein
VDFQSADVNDDAAAGRTPLDDDGCAALGIEHFLSFGGCGSKRQQRAAQPAKPAHIAAQGFAAGAGSAGDGVSA